MVVVVLVVTLYLFLRGSSYFSFLYDNIDYDLITKEKIVGKRNHMCIFKDSSAFYELYKADLIKFITRL